MANAILSWLCTPHHLVLARGHQVRRVTFPGWMAAVGVLGAGGLMAWGVAATGFIMVRDTLSTTIETRQAAVEDQYEDRITALRTQIARIRSQQVTDQGSVAERIDALLRRQATIEQRQAVVQSLTRGRGAAPALPDQDMTPVVAPPVAADAPDVSQSVRIRGKQAYLIPGAPQLASLGPASADPGMPVRSTGSLFTMLDGVSGSLDGVEQQQLTQLAALETHARRRVDRARDALSELGLDPDRLKPAHGAMQEGGPLVPLTPPGADAGAFERQVYRTEAAIVANDRLDLVLSGMPLRHPFAHAEITSGFGARLDPFLGTAAIHPGIDFRQEEGAPVRVTAGGRVTQAGWVGGYGNMVEVDHGNGVATRYGHLSAILVSVGETVRQGETVGRVGSTGRSTGPHLHYETRVAGEAIDPLRFMRAGDDLAGRG